MGLRALVTVASAGVAKGLPKVPKGGVWEKLTLGRFAAVEGVTMSTASTASTARVVADGTVVLMGATLGTAGVGARVTGACGDGTRKDGSHWHHIATDKSHVSDARGGPWTPRFQKIFDKAGMSLDDPRNRVYLQGHQGPHPRDYHEEVFDRLRDAMEGCRNRIECARKLEQALDKLAGRICTPGSSLYKLLTKTP